MGERKLLAIDDDPFFREFLEDFLKGTDFDAVVTGDAVEFKKTYAEHHPDAIILDIVMPEPDGFELMQWLTGAGYKDKVVLVTGFNPRYAEMAETLGTDHGLTDVVTLAKPVRLADLRNALGIG